MSMSYVKKAFERVYYMKNLKLCNNFVNFRPFMLDKVDSFLCVCMIYVKKEPNVVFIGRHKVNVFAVL